MASDTSQSGDTTSFCLHDVIDAHAAARPRALATVCASSRITWEQMRARSHALAAELHDVGVGPGDRVLWWGQNCHRVLEALVAASRLGAVVCVANWRQSAPELAFVLGDAAPTVVLWQEQEIGAVAHAARADGAGRDAVWIQHDTGGPDGYEGRIARRGPRAHPPGNDAAAVLMMYTAAFDGQVNGALLSHRALLAQSMTLRLLERLDDKTVYLNSGPMFHIGSLRRTLAVLHAGGRNIVCRRVEAPVLCELIDAEGSTHAFLQPPTMVQMVEANADGRFDLSSLRSRPGPPGWAEMVTVVDEPAVSSGYGQTEVAGVVTFGFGDRPATGAWPGPLANVEVHTPDGVPVGPGQVGEIVVRGPMVMNGYHNRAALSAHRSRGGWHHTNDLGRLECDGSISFVAPLQRIIKSAAENIYPVEVEAALRAHPAVDDAAVLGVPDDVWGQRVKAVVVAHAPVGGDELADFCRGRIARYKCPRIVEFVSSLPRNATGLDRDALDTRHGGGGYPGASTTNPI
jgi:acyl-CoA synthetase (AMP-forming)/AMP-acid ligase II